MARQQELDSRYEPAGLEPGLYERWQGRGYFHVSATDAARPYVVVIPPPNVTAALHMGHGLNNTLQDVLIRWRRMSGDTALWVPGTDHAGIATQNVVERQLAEEGTRRWDLGRERFVDRVWEWVETYGSRIVEQLKLMGCSCDWQRSRFTLDEGLSRAVREVFVRLYEKDLVYRANYIVNWCPRCGTTLSNEEAEHKDHGGHLYHIRYPLVGSNQEAVVVATTRPETLLGDTAVAVHPSDERYAGLVGKELRLPLTERTIPVVADTAVDCEFGTGAVKVTPAHDPNDFEIAGRHDLPKIDIMNDDATLSDAVPEAYRGLDRFEARKRVIADLEASGQLIGTEDHAHSVGHCYRCDTIVEPRLSLQWFVSMKPLAEPALAAYRSGDLRFHPEHYGSIYAHWLENVRDWPISRQLWWGHRIPVWYCQNDECGATVVLRADPECCPECGAELVQDPDVLDTWFSSWLWPFSTLGWPEKTEDLEAFYPTATLVTAADILFFWVARMVMAGLEFMGELPFTDVVINGTVRDHLGRRMSKSLGNGIDPVDVMDRFGADAMRFTLAHSAPIGTDILLNYEDLDASFRVGRNFANKIWNAARFALPLLDEADADVDLEAVELELADRWILSRLRATARHATASLDRFRFDEAAEAAYQFVWSEFADWYLELIKPRMYGDRGDASRKAAAATLWHVLDGWLRLLHPAMPFITEELATRLPGRSDEFTLMFGPWPAPPDAWSDPDAERQMDALQELIGTVRNLRAEYNVQPGTRVDVHIASPSEALQGALRAESAGVRVLGRVEELVESATATEDGPGAHAVLRSGGELFIPLSAVIDVEKERVRLQSELQRVQNLLEGTRAKLANEKFLGNAPPEVVEREREKEGSLQDQHARLSEKRGALGE